MKKILFTLLIMSVCSVASAQVVIENPTVGSVVQKATAVELNGQEITSQGYTSTVVVADSVALGESFNTGTLSSAGTVLDVIRVENWQGALEFSLDSVSMPTSFTASNFTARLIGISGQPVTDSVSLSVDLFDMTDVQEDFLIQDFDYDIAANAVSINGDPYINGEFESGEIDVTAQLRADLFGDDTEGVSTGFILQGSGGTGLVAFPGIADAYIEMNLVGSDTSVDSDSETGASTVSTDSDTLTDTDQTTDTATVGSDTATTVNGTDTTADTASSATDTSSGNTATDDTEDDSYWEVVDEDSDGIADGNNGGDGDGNVKCTCTAAGSATAKSLWNLLF